MRKFGRFFVMMLGVLTMALLSGCGDFEKQAYNTVLVAGKTYDLTMKTAGSLYAEKKITEEQKKVIIAAGTIYYGAYQAAVEALLVYHNTKEKESAKEKASLAVSQMILKFNAFIECYNDITKGIEGLSPETKLEVLKE